MFDATLQLANKEDITATGTTSRSVDLSQVRDIGDGLPMYAIFIITESVVAAGAAKVNFQVVTDDNGALSSPTVIASSGDIGKSELVAGHSINVPIPPSNFSSKPIGELFVGARLLVSTGPATSGKVSAWINDSMVSQKKNYPSGFNVL